ncbi:MAG: UDP-galactopyranose mutase [Methanoculleus marisnigri]|jgi:Protoporphyrinogen oxidase|uniref:UDP-galactopyranose mutase n=1 Tax=Methanoculleus marisnigri TaxID=2198 RepID=A0A124G5D4_9EURY|nr:FAD-dependent oxidoreductase [Methanoculleus marisnigri]KUL02881.1 MAG: UDP-galactopyranose mutase [Methanoculleus marisnigri]
MNVKSAVLGGGLTGITLARLLHEQGDDVTVLERDETIGGLCRSRTEAGFTFDVGGSHILFSRDTEVLSFMLSVLGKNADRRKRNTKILYAGRYVKYPFENGLYQLPDEDRFFCINEFVKNLIAVEKGEVPPPENFAEWITYTFGRGIAECYMIPYNEKIWNFPADRMSHHWVEGRIPRPPVEDIIRSAIGIETEGYVHQAVFSYPVTGGIEALVRAIAEPVLSAIRTGFSVASVREEKGGFAVSDGIKTVHADRLISTIPLQNLLPCLADVPADVQAACDALRYNSLCSVFIGLSGEVPDISWLYVPDPETGLFNRISFPSNYSTEVAPPGHSSVLAEITYNEGDAVSEMTDAEIIEHTIGSLIAAGIIPSRDNVAYTGVARQKFAYVVYDTDYLQNIEIVREFCRERRIDLVGRFSQFEYLNMDGCIRSAIDFVRANG